MGIVGTNQLDDDLDDIGGLEIGGDDIVALVGTEEGLLIINEVADKGGCQEAIESGKHDGHADTDIGEDKGQEQRKNNTSYQNDDADPTVEVTEDGDDFIDLGPVLIIKGLIEYIADGSTYAQLYNIEKAQQVVEGTGKANEIGSQRIEEYLSREERQDQIQEIKYQIDTCIKEGLLDT